MGNLRKHLFLGMVVAVLCLGAFVTTSSAQRHGRGHFSISFSSGTPYRYYPRYYRPVYRPAPVYYTPAQVYYSNYGYFDPGYYNSGYYAPAYNSGYYVTTYRRHRRNSCRYYPRY
jgi:hypothetical protein